MSDELPVQDYRAMSRAARGWGRRARTAAEAVKADLTGSLTEGFGAVDRGSLLRIADACEQTAQAVAALAREVRGLRRQLKRKPQPKGRV